MRIILKPFGIVAVATALMVTAYLYMIGSPYVSGKLGADGRELIDTTETSANMTQKDIISTKPQVIYDNILENEWEISGWARELKTDDATLDADGGGKSIVAAFRLEGKYEGIRFDHSPFRTNGFDCLTMKIYGGPKGGQKLRITGLLRGKPRTGVTIVVSTHDTWETFKVKLSDLGIANRFTATGFLVQSATMEAQEPIHIDDIRLLPPDVKKTNK